MPQRNGENNPKTEQAITSYSYSRINDLKVSFFLHGKNKNHLAPNASVVRVVPG